MAAAVKSRGRGGRGAASAIVRVPEPPPCSCRGPWAFPAGAGDGRGDSSGGAEREKLLWRPLRAPEPLTGPSSRGPCSPRRGSWSSGGTPGWAGCSGWSCWKLWSASGNPSPAGPRKDVSERQRRRGAAAGVPCARGQGLAGGAAGRRGSGPSERAGRGPPQHGVRGLRRRHQHLLLVRGGGRRRGRRGREGRGRGVLR